MKHFFTLLLSVTFVYTQAQFTLTAAKCNPQAGDQFTRFQETSGNSFNPGPAGAGVSWDFSSLVASDSSLISMTSANNNDFPSANISFSLNGSNRYYEASSSSYTFFGTQGSSITVSYSNGQELINFPMNYGDSYIDLISASVDFSGQNGQRSGVTNVELDAYGSLQTPEAIYNEAMRVKIIRNDTEYIAGNAIANIDTTYYWYVEKFNFPVMTYGVAVNSGQPNPSVTISYLKDSPSLSQTENGLGAITMYPNPASSFVEIKGVANPTIEIVNLAGQTVKKQGGTNKVSLENIKRGIYLVCIKAKGKKEEKLRLLIK